MSNNNNVFSLKDFAGQFGFDPNAMDEVCVKELKAQVYRRIAYINNKNDKSVLFYSNNYMEAIAYTLVLNPEVQFKFMINVVEAEQDDNGKDIRYTDFNYGIVENGIGSCKVTMNNLQSAIDTIAQLESAVQSEIDNIERELILKVQLIGLDKSKPIVVESSPDYVEKCKVKLAKLKKSKAS